MVRHKITRPTKIPAHMSVADLSFETMCKSSSGMSSKSAIRKTRKNAKRNSKRVPVQPDLQVKFVSNRTLVKEEEEKQVSETDTDDIDGYDSSSKTDFIEESANDEKKSKSKGGLKCTICSFSAHSSTRLEKHVSRVHDKNVNYNCNVCDFSCKWNREYYSHMKTHFPGPPFCCEVCEYTCDVIYSLLTHRMKHTDEYPFQCDQCDYRCRTKVNLDTHMRCHTGEKPYQCELCERCFATSGTLNQHFISHSEDRPFICDTCGFRAKYQSHLNSHKRIHTGDVFHCPFPNCKYSTPKKNQLEAHQRTHTGERSYTCHTCGRGFIEKRHLHRHELVHLNEKSIKCDHCDYCTSRRDKLKEHFERYHGECATAKGPFRPRKRRREYEASAAFPSDENASMESEHQLPSREYIE